MPDTMEHPGFLDPRFQLKDRGTNAWNSRLLQGDFGNFIFGFFKVASDKV